MGVDIKEAAVVGCEGILGTIAPSGPCNFVESVLLG